MDYSKVSGAGRVSICAKPREINKALIAGTSVSAIPPAPECNTPAIRDKAAQADRHLGSLNSFWASSMDRKGVRYIPPLLRISSDGQTSCGNSDPIDLMKYCPRDHTINRGVDQPELMRVVTGISGEAVDAFSLAHEVGHHIQKLDGTLDAAAPAIYNGTLAPNPSPQDRARAMAALRALEEQADCYAGAWVRNEFQSGRFNMKDVDTVRQFVERIGEDSIANLKGVPYNPAEDSHGTSIVRKASYLQGLLAKTIEYCRFRPGFQF